MKWSFIDSKNWPHYVVANADESEPGTFKDREIMEGNPYQFLKGWRFALMPSKPMLLTFTCGVNSGRLPPKSTNISPPWKPPDCWATDSSAQIIHCTFTHTWARCLHLRRGNRHARINGGQAWTATTAPAVPALLRFVRQTDCGEQCRNFNQRAHDHRARRGVVPQDWHRKSPGPKISHFLEEWCDPAITNCPWGQPSAS